ncbi:YbaB/EbfC family nucleoid-associated protein [Micromonospora sp. LH3U1]|uniref:YbaB/EbfC family nucleoid-associated protein n=1 Tax=Micromonospora sp. LH3U1 TaxID=3018339 RepID=UPI00234B1B39|nr:YbaB/EbfC family nucleoid-associated protein [Micromonospora sp. LH3U1]WCN84364.1 YbaB/EbfC family nucleoid-associated protein [Micromonospora sp. LH3U1]
MSDPMSAFDALAGRIADIESRFAGLRDNLAELSGTATDESGLVSATVDATGALTGLTIAPAALRTGTEGVAELVLDAYRRARATATEHVDEHTDGLEAALGTGLTDLFGKPGDFSALGRLEETVARIGRLDDRLPGSPA